MPSPKRSRPRAAKPRDGASASKGRGSQDPSGSRHVWSYRLRSPAETERVGEMLGRMLKGGEILALYGDLGVGKTTLVRGIATGLDVPPRAVTSPTFAMIHEHAGRLPLVHADLYRLGAKTELAHLGLGEYLNGRTVVAVEWADKASDDLPDDRLDLYLSHEGARTRRLLGHARGRHACKILARLRRSVVSRRAAERER